MFCECFEKFRTLAFFFYFISALHFEPSEVILNININGPVENDKRLKYDK